MSRTSGRYGSRGRLRGIDQGIRRVAPTFGKALFSTYSTKAVGEMAVEADAERLVGDMLTLDPGVRQFWTQPFTVDLIDRRILRTRADVADARSKYKGLEGSKLYTPDFEADYHTQARIAIEVKMEGFEGSEQYAGMLSLARSLLESSGYRFLRVVIPEDPWHPVHLNVGVLANAALRPDLRPTADEADAVVAACGEEGKRLGCVCESLGMSSQLAPAWLVSGVITADVAHHPINFDLHVRPAHGDLSHLSLFEEFAK